MLDDGLRNAARAGCRDSAAAVATLTRSIYTTPELSGEEHQAREWCQTLLIEHGFEVDSVPGVETAFVATLTRDADGPTIGFLAEYDALPGLGHACGHHLIAGSAVSAGLALASCRDAWKGTVQVFGCPAEETGKGKVAMLDAGAFGQADVCLTFHANDITSVMTASTGVAELAFEFHGRPAHASSDPWSGASALDGVLLTFQNVNALRQFIRDRSRIHGIITAGGDAPNIVPEYAACRFMVRSADSVERDRIADRVLEAARAAALASATKLVVSQGMRLDPVLLNAPLAQIVRSNLEREGETVTDWPALASTDFGNVSTAIPSVLFSVATWPIGTLFHTHEATARAGEDAAFAAMNRAAKVMALSACDMFTDPELVDQAKQAHMNTSRTGFQSVSDRERGAQE